MHLVMRSQGMSQSFGPAERLSEVMTLQRPGAGADAILFWEDGAVFSPFLSRS